MVENIVILSYNSGYTNGVVRYVKMLKEGLSSKSNFGIHTIVLDTNILFPDIKWKSRGIFARIPFEISSLPFNEIYWQMKYFKVVADILIPYFVKQSNIVWHVQELFLCKLADLLKSVLGGKIILHLHILPWKFVLEKNERLFNRLYTEVLGGNYGSINENSIEKTAYELSDKIICVSHSAEQYVISAFKIESKKISVIFNGMNKLTNNKMNTDECVPNILFVGRVIKEKGVFELLKALKRLRLMGVKISLKLVGDCTDEMKLQISHEYKEVDFEICGKMSFGKLCKLYSSDMIGVIPSLHEQCSYVAIEMSMFGMPMIVSDVDALSEMFDDEVNALKIPLVFDEDFGIELNQEKMMDSIVRLINDKELRRKLSINAIKNYQSNFTLKTMIENTINVYEQLMVN